MYCDRANAMNMATIKKVPDLTSCRVSGTKSVVYLGHFMLRTLISEGITLGFRQPGPAYDMLFR